MIETWDEQTLCKMFEFDIRGEGSSSVFGCNGKRKNERKKEKNSNQKPKKKDKAK
jgi:hypothetical protein